MKRWMRLGLAATIATTVVTSVGSGVDARSRGDLEAYISPTFGVTLEYDASIWSVFQDTEADAQNPGDILGLETDEVAGGLVIDVHDEETDADDCLEETVAFGLDGSEDAELIEDDDGEPIEGSSRGHAYAAYRFLSDGDHFGGFFACQEFGDELGVVVFMLFTQSRDFDAGYELTLPIVDSVDDSDAHAKGEDDGDSDRDEDEDDRDEEDQNDDRDEEDEDESGDRNDTGVYEPELFDYALPYNAENWTPVETRSNNGNESADFEGPDGETLTVMTFPAEGTEPVQYTEYYAESFGREGDVEVEVFEDPDTGDTIERRNSTEAYTLYTFEYDGETFLLYTHAITSDDGRFVVMVIGTSLISSYDLLEEDVFPLLDQIEYE